MITRLFSVLVVFTTPFSISALHLEGTWHPTERYRFLAKFAFQRTQIDELEATRGYVYGTIQSTDAGKNRTAERALATLVLVDSEFILSMYGNATEPLWSREAAGLSKERAKWISENNRCQRIFANLDQIAWHRVCAPHRQMDLLRSVPCPSEGLCAEEDRTSRVIPGSQFTYTVQDLRQPRYWYLNLVACARNKETCKWETTSVPSGSNDTHFRHQSTVAYSIWLVNGAPHLQSYNKFEHQFSFESHDTAEMFLVFLLLYLALSLFTHVKLYTIQQPHTVLYLTSLWLATLGALLTTIHLGVFSFDGRGLGHLSEFGTLLTQWADALLLALLISTAEVGFLPAHSVSAGTVHSTTVNSGSKSVDHKVGSHLNTGYEQLLPEVDDENDGADVGMQKEAPPMEGGLTRRPQGISWPYLVCLILFFVAVKTLLYVWSMFDRDPVIDLLVWSTVPGCLLLAVRFGVAFWFLAILRRRQMEIDQLISLAGSSTIGDANDFILGPNVDLVHFAAGYLLWIFVLPLVVFIAETSVSPLWRNKTILSVCFSADYIASSVYAYLLWRSSTPADMPV